MIQSHIPYLILNITTFTIDYEKKLLVKIFENGKCVYDIPDINEIRNYCKKQVSTLWEEVLRFDNPHKYYVDLSKPLWDIKTKLLEEYSMK